jgi:hypothetical protein
MAKDTDIMTLRSADWTGVERDVLIRLRLLRAMAEKLEPNPINDKIANDLIMPCLRLLGDFCTRIKVDE